MFTFLFGKETLGLSSYEKSLRKLQQETAGKYDKVYCSHGSGDLTVDYLERLIEDCQQIKAGKDDKVPFEFMGQKANKETLEAMDGVMTVVQSGGQYQVVIGNAVKDVYETIIEQTAIQGGKDTAEEDSQEVKGSLLDRFIDLISSIFTPILSVLVATGMIKGFTALEVMAPESGTAQMLNIIGDAFFYFLPIFLGLSAARKFGMHEFTGMAVAAALVYPTLPTIMNGEKMYTLFAGNC